MNIIIYRSDIKPRLDDAIALYSHCSLGKRRPLDDKLRFQSMLDNANLIITAWRNNTLIGIARCITDFVYATYLSDLAVHEDYQKQGIGKKLIKEVQKNTQSNCKIILLAAPQAETYYPKLGFDLHHSAWVLSKFLS